MDYEEVGRLWDANAEAWTKLVRAGYDHYRDGLNTPAFLDIGCGGRYNTRSRRSVPRN